MNIMGKEDTDMRTLFLGLGVMLQGLLAMAGTCRADSPAKDADIKQRPSTERRLRLPETPFRYADIELPVHFTTPAARRFDNTPNDNRVTDAGATLGRVLFYDTRLSAS